MGFLRAFPFSFSFRRVSKSPSPPTPRSHGESASRQVGQHVAKQWLRNAHPKPEPSAPTQSQLIRPIHVSCCHSELSPHHRSKKPLHESKIQVHAPEIKRQRLVSFYFKRGHHAFHRSPPFHLHQPKTCAHSVFLV